MTFIYQFSLTEELSQSYGKMVDVAIKYDCQPLFGDNKRKVRLQ